MPAGKQMLGAIVTLEGGCCELPNNRRGACADGRDNGEFGGWRNCRSCPNLNVCKGRKPDLRERRFPLRPHQRTGPVGCRLSHRALGKKIKCRVDQPTAIYPSKWSYQRAGQPLWRRHGMKEAKR